MEQINQQDNLSNVVQAMSELSLSEIDFAMQKLIELRKEKLPSVLSQKETEILKKVNRPVPGEINSRYNNLKEKRDQHRLSAEEHQEIIELTTYLEQHNVERLQALIELAKIRNISLTDLIESLELKPMLDAS